MIKDGVQGDLGLGLRHITAITEHQMSKKMENNSESTMQTWVIWDDQGGMEASIGSRVKVRKNGKANATYHFSFRV